MATNPYFNFFNHSGEQNLYDDLIVESIKVYAHDMYYLPRTGKSKDDIMNEYEISEFNDALPVEFYIRNFDSFEGEGQLLAKFGLEIREQMTLDMSRRSYEQFIQPTTDNPRPYEGDCIYVPMINTVYQIKYVNTAAIFYTLGKLNTYQIVCELLEFSNEVFNTGVSEIDNLNKTFENADTEPNYDIDDHDPTNKNSEIETSANSILDFSETNPFGDE